jgi:hypothetical protein
MAKPICTDDYGESVYRCYYTDVIVWASSAELWPSPIPQCKAKYVVKTSDSAKIKHKENFAAFNENDANCNTCVNLIREEHEKCKAGFLYGICAKGNETQTPYYDDSAIFKFHPGDHMGMKCWRPRVSKEKV